MTEPIYNQSDDAIRGAFERFAASRGWSLDQFFYSGVYASAETRSAWLSWLGAMDLIRREANEH